ncbi:hypothetical protein HAZT_HAZT007458 [Hyalella azteca]|uniref:Asparaginase n=1 Tax=Hyalella azteca TaxID=294128 RepID=A0A6A0H6U9_HYAAZ|nr:hypothetical protein HAZT_HAZT007458 [Hyalella azteca]
MAVEGRHVVAVHGGAWDIPEPLWEASLTGVKLAALRAFEVMDAGGSAVDAVEAAVVLMEEDPVFDAVYIPFYKPGRGSVLTSAGTVEGCALIMSGSDLSTGAVACVSNLLNPVSLARRVMTKTPHALLSGQLVYIQASAGADAFARSEGVQQLPVEELITEEARRQLALYQHPMPTQVGCGGYADDAAGAVSTTGHGESLMKACLAHRVTQSLRHGEA